MTAQQGEVISILEACTEELNAWLATAAEVRVKVLLTVTTREDGVKHPVLALQAMVEGEG